MMTYATLAPPTGSQAALERLLEAAEGAPWRLVRPKPAIKLGKEEYATYLRTQSEVDPGRQPLELCRRARESK